MRPEILHLPPASLRSFPRFLSFALLLSLSLSCLSIPTLCLFSLRTFHAEIISLET